MYCKNCGSEIGKNDKFCANCGYDSIELSHDLDCVTKISTPLFWLFGFLSLGIYGWVKWFRITGDLRKIITKEETVSPIIITIAILLSISNNFIGGMIDSLPISDNIQPIFILISILLLIIGILLLCYMTYRTLNNIKKIARIKQNKDLKYNKIWAFIFNIMYINFVINTYDQRLVENNK